MIDGHYPMHLNGIQFFYLSIAIWLVFLFIAFWVYRDAREKEKNAILWFILVAIPWMGILFLAIYMVLREEEEVETAEDIRKKAFAILDERYAKGEITEEEYQKMKRDIEEAKWE